MRKCNTPKDTPTRLDRMDKKKHHQEQLEKWKNSTTTMKERKPHREINTNTKTITRCEQVIRSSAVHVLETTELPYAAVINKEPRSECSFCAVNLTIDHIL
jgi:ADP-ribosylglycohydrolase